MSHSFVSVEGLSKSYTGETKDAWNQKNPEQVSMAYTHDSQWRNRSEFINGRAEIVDFLKRKWDQELEYRLVKELWAYSGHRIAVRFAYEYHTKQGLWFRAYGNENWVFSKEGLMQKRHASINDVGIKENERLLLWDTAVRPEDYASLSDLGL